MRLLVLLPIVKVPPPLNVTVEPLLGPLMMRSVTLPAEFNLILPAFEMVEPEIVREMLLLKLRLSSLSMVRLAAAPATSSVTADACGLPLSMKTLRLLVGTPFDQLPATLQLPVVEPVQQVAPPGQAMCGRKARGSKRRPPLKPAAFPFPNPRGERPPEGDIGP